MILMGSSKMKMCCLLQEVHRACYVKFIGATVYLYICRDSSIRLAYEGECNQLPIPPPVPCPAIACPEIYSPVCASDGTTYANDCFFDDAQCRYTLKRKFCFRIFKYAQLIKI